MADLRSPPPYRPTATWCCRRRPSWWQPAAAEDAVLGAGGKTVLAAFYKRQGPAAEVLQLGELPEPTPGPGEVVVRLTRSGINPGDVKKRQGWLGSTMPYPLVVPHSDGAGTIIATATDVPAARIGQRVWCWGAQSYRPFGTAAAACAVPADQAVPLPPNVSDDLGACLGIPGITAHRAVFADGDPSGTVLVHGAGGAVGSLAAQLARSCGVRVIGTVRFATEAPRVRHLVDEVVALDGADTEGTARAIRQLAPDGVSRIVEVALAANATLDA